MCSMRPASRRWCERLARVVVAMTADPRSALSSIEVLEAEERPISRWVARPGGAGQPDAGGSIPALFAAQVGRTPDAVALTAAKAASMTYRELDEASNRLAHLLVGQGVGPRRCVALLLNRSARGGRGDGGGTQGGGGLPARSTRLCPTRGSSSWWPTPPRSQCITTASLAERLAGQDLAVLDVDDPRDRGQPSTRRCRPPTPRTSRTSSTPREPPGSPREWRSPTAT